MATNVFQGRIEKLFPTFGFLISENTGQKFFFSKRDTFTPWYELRLRDRVSFMVGSTAGQHPEAIHIFKEGLAEINPVAQFTKERKFRTSAQKKDKISPWTAGWILDCPTQTNWGHIAAEIEGAWAIVEYAGNALLKGSDLQALTGGAYVLFELKHQLDTYCYHAEKIALRQPPIPKMNELPVGNTRNIGWAIQQYEVENKMGFIIARVEHEWRFVIFDDTAFENRADFDNLELGQPVSFKAVWRSGDWAYKAHAVMYL